MLISSWFVLKKTALLTSHCQREIMLLEHVPTFSLSYSYDIFSSLLVQFFLFALSYKLIKLKHVPFVRNRKKWTIGKKGTQINLCPRLTKTLELRILNRKTIQKIKSMKEKYRSSLAKYISDKHYQIYSHWS